MRLYLRAIGYFSQDWAGIVVSLALIGVSTLMGLLQPFPLAILIDSVFKQTPSDHWVHRMFLSAIPSDRLGQILALAGFTLGLRVAQELITVVQTFVAIRVGYSGLLRVRCELFSKLQALSLAYHRAQPQGDAIYRLSTDTFGFQTIFNTVVNAILVSTIMLAVMAVIMLSMNWRLTLIALAITPLLLWLTSHSMTFLHLKWDQAKQVDAAMTTAIQRSIAAIGLVQAFGREAEEYARFHNTARSSVSAYLRVHWFELLYAMMIGVVFGVGGAVIFGYGGYLVYRDQYLNPIGEGGMTIGKLYVFLAYLTQLYSPLQRLTGAGATLQSGAVGAKRVFEVLDRDPVIFDAPDAIALPRQPRQLDLCDVAFEYRAGETVFEDVSFHVAPGQMVGLVGFSGVGKTTLLNLLPRFYDPTRGSIELDGHDIRKVKIVDLRRHIAMVLQENIVLPTSIAENIAYGRPHASDEQIRAAAKMARADEFIDKLKEKYQTQVSESGSNLSGGQRQRLAIARALLTEAPILVLDEPTSALDPQNEQMITEMLYSLRGQRTIVLVSHRLSTVADCDIIYLMSEGRLVEQGTHDQLLARRGIYYSMARHQLKLD